MQRMVALIAMIAFAVMSTAMARATPPPQGSHTPNMHVVYRLGENSTKPCHPVASPSCENCCTLIPSAVDALHEPLTMIADVIVGVSRPHAGWAVPPALPPPRGA